MHQLLDEISYDKNSEEHVGQRESGEKSHDCANHFNNGLGFAQHRQYRSSDAPGDRSCEKTTGGGAKNIKRPSLEIVLFP